jgi:arylsulfatase A-like enzyme
MHADDKAPQKSTNGSTTGLNRRNILLGGTAIAAVSALAATDAVDVAQAQQPASAPGGRKPNILVIWGDDIGWQNVSAYGLGTMGYTTPNIDSIGKAGIIFTDHYAQPSCTAGRAAFVTGQFPIRSGMTTVGQPGDPLGLQPASPCIAEVMKEAGYATGHFGKSHLGDRNEHLPTNHGFDEFYGNLYHLNVSEEDEQRDYKNFAKAYPGGPEAYAKKFGARGLIHSIATDQDDPTVDPRFGKVGKQKIVDTGPLTQERMKTVDGEEVIPRAQEFMKKANQAGKPFFMWLNPTRMHVYTRLSDKWRYAAENISSEVDLHGSGMMQHDYEVGQVLKFLRDNSLEDNTIVWYSTDNGPEHSSWPHGATTPFHGEKMTTYEGGVRVISMLKWPGVVKPGQVLNGIQDHQDMFVSFASAAGVKDVAAKIKQQKKQYIDGIDNTPYWKGETDKSARNHELMYFESRLTAIRMGPWKWHFALKEDYYDNMTGRNYPKVFNLRMDPFESYGSVDSYGHLLQKVSWMLGPMSELMRNHLQTLAEFPPVQGGKSFDMSNAVQEFIAKAQQ